MNFLQKFSVKQKGFNLHFNEIKPFFQEHYEKKSNYFGQWYKNKKNGEGLLIQGDKQYQGHWSANVFIEEVELGKMKFFINNVEIELVEHSKKFVETNFKLMYE